MKLIVFGATGQVGRELARRRPSNVQAVFLDRSVADLSRPDTCVQAISASNAHAVINAAAWTAVDEAETDEAAATLVNGDAPGAMARACAERRIPFLHVSTDYVFDGAGVNAFRPDDPTAPLGAYGRSKLAGEIGVRASGARHLILRTSWVFSAHGANFVKTMLRLGRERDCLRVVADQIGGPTPASDIADALYVAARAMVEGQGSATHHFSGAPDVSWADFARAIMKGAGLPCRIDDIPSSGYPTAAKRPQNSRLECSSFQTDFGIPRPDWRHGLDRVLTDLGAKI